MGEIHIMAHNIYGNRIAVREPAWHKLGTIFGDQKPTATEAMGMADMLFDVKKYPNYFKKEDGSFQESIGYAIVREPTNTDNTHEPLATVGEQYTPIQARDLGKLLDPITAKFPVESAGALGKGEKIFLSLDASESTIAGEDHHLYWLVTDSRDGTSGLTIAFTPVRVVCQNTLVTGLRSAKVSVSLRHTKSIKDDATFYIDILKRTQESVVEKMNSLTSVKLQESEINQIMDTAYPKARQSNRFKLSDGIIPDDVPKNVYVDILKDRNNQHEEWEKRQLRIDKIKADAMQRLEIFNQEFGHLANTPWAVYNAIVESEDYRNGSSTSSTAIFGTRAKTKERAFSKALDYVR